MGHQQVTMSASNVPATAEAPAAAAFRYSAPYAAGPAYGYGGPQYGGAQYGGAMVAAAPGYGYGAPAPLAPVHAPMAAAGPAPVSYGGPDHHVYHSGRVAEDLRAEETYLEYRRKLTEDLRKAETNEAAAVDKRYNDERICEIRTAEAHEQSRRAATAEAIAARATEELRLREAEAKAPNAAAAEAKALCERAAEADRRATEARNTKAQAARESESVLAKSVADNEAAAAQLANCEGAAANTPLPGSYCSGPYQRQYAYGGPGAAPAAQYGYRGYGY